MKKNSGELELTGFLKDFLDSYGVQESIEKMFPFPQNSLYIVDVTAYLRGRVA